MENGAIEKKREVLKMSNIKSNLFTKECVRTALLSLMSIKIFEQITVTEIIKKAGISKGGFYRNYRSKEEVLQEICEELLQYILEFMTEHRLHENPRLWFIDFFHNIEENKESYFLLINAKAPKNVVLEFDESCIIQKLQKDESVVEQYRALAIAKGLSEIISVWVKNGMQETPEEMADVMLQIFFMKN